MTAVRGWQRHCSGSSKSWMQFPGVWGKACTGARAAQRRAAEGRGLMRRGRTQAWSATGEPPHIMLAGRATLLWLPGVLHSSHSQTDARGLCYWRHAQCPAAKCTAWKQACLLCLVAIDTRCSTNHLCASNKGMVCNWRLLRLTPPLGSVNLVSNVTSATMRSTGQQQQQQQQQCTCVSLSLS